MMNTEYQYSNTGIGAAAAIEFIKEKGNVVIVGRNEHKLNDTLDRCTKFGKIPFVVIADISKDEEAKRVVEETIGKFGISDVLVNNAGFVKYGTILSETKMSTKNNLRAKSLAAQYLIKVKGTIINISSVAGKFVPKYVSGSM
ncbi:short-chain dehydrogenase/reductase homolog YusS-like [Leptidea sinapis]|uniref:short-chain dehydrogenase/reductase homolog YusS-like n=1 Tax=Leptidea sinapis TaxID=189913 RepID=UPI0021C3AEB0|nr:short-chain dehydrogenase/reductase homolog YusS-like [Leptidea sinapis]